MHNKTSKTNTIYFRKSGAVADFFIDEAPKTSTYLAFPNRPPFRLNDGVDLGDVGAEWATSLLPVTDGGFDEGADIVGGGGGASSVPPSGSSVLIHFFRASSQTMVGLLSSGRIIWFFFLKRREKIPPD